MKDATNAIDTMLYLQKANSADHFARPLHELSLNDTMSAEYDEQNEEQALSTINRCVKFFGSTATKELEEHMELLQEAFICHIEKVLNKYHIKIQEKLILSLSADDKLILQCQEQEDALLNAFGNDENIVNQLKELRKVALVGRGLDYILAVQNDHAQNLPPFRVCTKGSLSHFYFSQR